MRQFVRSVSQTLITISYGPYGSVTYSHTFSSIQYFIILWYSFNKEHFPRLKQSFLFLSTMHIYDLDSKGCWYRIYIRYKLPASLGCKMMSHVTTGLMNITWEWFYAISWISVYKMHINLALFINFKFFMRSIETRSDIGTRDRKRIESFRIHI